MGRSHSNQEIWHTNQIRLPCPVFETPADLPDNHPTASVAYVKSENRYYYMSE